MIFRALIFLTVICLENVAGATTTTEFWPGKDCPVDESIGKNLLVCNIIKLRIRLVG